MSTSNEDKSTAGELRQDDFHGVKVHTFARRGRPCWLLFEIERALGAELADFNAGAFDPFEGEDFEQLDDEAAAEVAAQLDYPALGHPLIVLFESGITRACAGHKAGHELRRKLLKEAAVPIARAARKARLEARVREMVKQLDLEDRARKAALLHRIIEHARRCGPLLRDDVAYVEAMAIVAEVATGHVFPTDTPIDDAMTSEAGEPAGSIRGALVALCEEINA